MPNVKDDSLLESAGSEYHEFREEVLLSEQIGLTQLYNRFHDPNNTDSQIQILREMHRNMDAAVLAAYGWNDVCPEHDFHEVLYLPENDRIRYTISHATRLELLKRLADLNHKRFEEEVEKGLHGKNASGKKAARPSARGKSSQETFKFEGALSSATNGEGTPNLAAEKIRALLKARRSWLSKADILAYVEMPHGQWNAAINDLLARGIVERQGERRGARYRISESD